MCVCVSTAVGTYVYKRIYVYTHTQVYMCVCVLKVVPHHPPPPPPPPPFSFSLACAAQTGSGAPNRSLVVRLPFSYPTRNFFVWYFVFLRFAVIVPCFLVVVSQSAASRLAGLPNNGQCQGRRRQLHRSRTRLLLSDARTKYLETAIRDATH